MLILGIKTNSIPRTPTFDVKKYCEGECIFGRPLFLICTFVLSVDTKADILSNSGPEITAIERTSAMDFNRQILAGATVRFENIADSQSELELNDARYWQEQQWTLASRTVCLFCWFCREAARSPLPACGLRIMAAILILLDVEDIVKSITK